MVHEVSREFWRDDLHASYEGASPSFRLVAAVAEYAEILRGSYWAQESSLEDVLALVRAASAELDDDQATGADVSEFIRLVEQASLLARQG
jgi:Ca-activated chloride channel family protein